jgi:hypothetical protein
MRALRLVATCSAVLLCTVARAAPDEGGSADADAIRVFVAEAAARLKGKELKYVQQRVRLPFKRAWLSDGNPKKETLRKAAEVAERVEIPAALLRLLASSGDLEKTPAGGCDGDAVDRKAGPMVLVLKGKTATVTAPPEVCGAQADHNRVFQLARDKKGEWQLVAEGYAMVTPKRAE